MKEMQIITLTNSIAFLAVLALFVSYWDDYRKAGRISLGKIVAGGLVGITICILTVIKNGRDDKASELSERRADTARFTSYKLDSTKALIVESLSTINRLNEYVHRVDSIGIKRDSIKNQPVITKKFVNNIGYVGTLNQN